MNEINPAALSAEGEDLLKRLEADFNGYLQAGELGMAEILRTRHDGAAFMLVVLGLASIEEYKARTDVLFARYLEALFPDGSPKETV